MKTLQLLGFRPRWTPRSVGLSVTVGLALVVVAVGSWRLVSAGAAPDLAQIEAAIAARRFDEAAQGAQRLAQIDPRDPRPWFFLARARAGAGHLSAAVDALARVPDWSVRKSEAWFFTGQLLKKLNRGRDAEAAFRACIDRQARGKPSPLAANARLELMALYAMEERFDSFRRLFWEVYPDLGISDRLESLRMRMRSEFEQTTPELSRELLERYVEADPEDPHALMGLGAAHDHAGRLDEAIRCFTAAFRLRPVDPEIRARYLDALYRGGDQEALHNALATDSVEQVTDAAIANLLGIVAQGKGRLEAAAAAYARAVELRPDVPEYHHRLGQTYARLGQEEAAARRAAERARLNDAREGLRKAWNAFSDIYDVDPSAVPVELLSALSEACAAADWPREAEAWAELARNWRAVPRLR